MTRLLKTPIIGRSETIVPSSWIDMLAGLSGSYIFRMPPGFCANATLAAAETMSIGAAIANALRSRFIAVFLPLFVAGLPLPSILETQRRLRLVLPTPQQDRLTRLLVEPDVFEARAVVDAVDHD